MSACFQSALMAMTVRRVLRTVWTTPMVLLVLLGMEGRSRLQATLS